MVVRLDRDGPSKSTWLPARPGGPANAVLDGRFFLVRRPRSYVQLVSMRHSADPESMVRTTGGSPAAALRASAWTASICSRMSPVGAVVLADQVVGALDGGVLVRRAFVEVDVVADVPADAQAAEAMDPGVGPLRHPAVDAQAGAVCHATAGDDRCDAALA
jgi:hypothetical protein